MLFSFPVTILRSFINLSSTVWVRYSFLVILLYKCSQSAFVITSTKHVFLMLLKLVVMSCNNLFLSASLSIIRKSAIIPAINVFSFILLFWYYISSFIFAINFWLESNNELSNNSCKPLLLFSNNDLYLSL